jgi:hypothetical protein
MPGSSRVLLPLPAPSPQDVSARDLAQALPAQFAETTVGQLCQALAVGVVLALVLIWHHRRFTSIVSSRAELRNAIPFVLLTTVLVISVVKSSLALSLGLVGALSIVRFRTPLKEPEELAYVFLALAIGLGLGAGQVLITVVATGVILTFIAVGKLREEAPGGKQIYLSVDLAGASPGSSLGRLHDIIGRHAKSCDLRRYDTRDQGLEATYALDLAAVGDVDKLAAELRGTFPGMGITFLDQSRLPTV